jgi:hypothetical protein
MSNGVFLSFSFHISATKEFEDVVVSFTMIGSPLALMKNKK